MRRFRILASLKLAVFVILALSAALAAGTILESKYDTASAQYWVYRSQWFRGILGLLGINIFAVMVSRWPWQRRHMPFLFAHIGILTVLFGAWLTDRYGLDGLMRIGEGDTSSVVEVNDTFVSVTPISGAGQTRRIRIPWIPPGEPFHPIVLDSLGMSAQVDQFISRADAEVKFDAVQGGKPWIALKTRGGPIPFSQSFKLWAGDRSWDHVQAGPAVLLLKDPKSPGLESIPSEKPALELQYDSGGIAFRARSTSGKIQSGKFRADQIKGAIIDPGWTMGIQFVVTDYIPEAQARVEYAPARVPFGPQAPTLSAVHVQSRKTGQGAWVGLGDRIRLDDFEVGYFSSRVVLPFSVRLDRFQIDHYQGTLNPMEYSSKVTVIDEGTSTQKETVISMNEPLEHRGSTIYQASYEEGSPRPTVSIFSVNRDPGRSWKYGGSLLLVGGCILLFLAKRQKRKEAQVTS